MKVIILPIGEKDLSDYFDAGGTAEQLRELIDAAPGTASAPVAPSKIKPAGDAIFDMPADGNCLWGNGDQRLWESLEGLMIYGGVGVGKTSIAQQLVLASARIRPRELLGLPVAERQHWLVLALDRPAQFKRSLRRMVTEDQRDELNKRVTIHDGPLDFDVALEPDRLLLMAQQVGADAVLVDSVKDAAGDLEKTAGGQGLNRAFQLLVSNGVELVVLHHPRKAQVGNTKPKGIDNVYGSRFVCDGMGSVVLLWAEPGDAVVELIHLKQPRDNVGPLTLVHDHVTGTTSRQGEIDAYTIIHASNGISAEGIARQLFKSDRPTPAQVENARRKARALVSRNLATEPEPTADPRGGKPTALFYSLSPRAITESNHADHEANTRPITNTTNGVGVDTKSNHESNHADHGLNHETGPLFIERPDVCPEAPSSENCWLCQGPIYAYDAESRPVCKDHVPVLSR